MITDQVGHLPHESDGDGFGSRPRTVFLPLWWFGNLMAWFGGGHWRDVSDRHERSSYQIAGLFVLLNAFIAWGVATFAGVGVSGTAFTDVLPFTVPWGIFVGAFDRSIAGFIPPYGAGILRIRRVLAARVAMAIVLGVIVGELANLWFFARPIDHQMLLDIQRNTQIAQSGVVDSQGVLDGLIREQTSLNSAVDSANTTFQNANKAYICELKPQADCPRDGTSTGVAGDGPETRRRKADLDAASAALDNARADRNQVKVWVQPRDGQPPPTPQTLDAQITELETAKAGQLTQAAAVADADRGIDARWRAMHEYTLSETSALTLRLMVILGLIAIDLVPLATKLMRGHTGNDDRIRLRRDLLIRRNEVHRAKRGRELDDMIVFHARRQDVEAEIEELRNRARLEAIRAETDTDRAIKAELEQIRLERELKRLRAAAEQEPLGAPLPADEPKPAPAADLTAAEMVAASVPRWWSQRDLALRSMVFGGRFRVVGPLRGCDRGSFGRMLIAVDLQTDSDADERHVVVKAVPLPEEDNGALRNIVKVVRGTTIGRMWQKEIDATSHLAHRAVGRILSFGVDDGYLWTAAPYYRPGSLTRWIDRQERSGNAITLGELLRIAGEIAAALEVAHSSDQRVIHGDLKPDNVVLDGPQPVVIDWALARLAPRSAGPRSTGLPRGTRYFGAPEVFTEKNAFTGHYAPYVDLWSLGASLYFLLTGEMPLARDVEEIHGVSLEAERIAELANAGHIRVTPLAELVPGLPDEVCVLIHRLLSIEPQDRSNSAEPWAAAGELRHYIAYVAERAARRGFARMPVGPSAAMTARANAAGAAVGDVERRCRGPVPAVIMPTQSWPLPRTEDDDLDELPALPLTVDGESEDEEEGRSAERKSGVGSRALSVVREDLDCATLDEMPADTGDMASTSPSVPPQHPRNIPTEPGPGLGTR
jgi:hypothetical protein